MNALHPTMADALRGIIPAAVGEPLTPRPSAEAALQAARDKLESLLRTPFTFDVQTSGTRGCEPEYATCTADEDVVLEAVDWLIDKHMRELEGEVERRQIAKWKAKAAEGEL